MGAWFNMHNVTAVQCLQRQGTTRSDVLLTQKEEIFTLAAKRALSLLAFIRGLENSCADALSHLKGTSVKWQLCPQVLHSLTLQLGFLEIDLFASWAMAQLPQFLTFAQGTRSGETNDFTEDWSCLGFFYLPPPQRRQSS